MRAIKITETTKDGANVSTYFYHNKTWYCLDEVYGGDFGYSDELLVGLTLDMIRHCISKVDNVTIIKENEIIPNEYIKLITE